MQLHELSATAAVRAMRAGDVSPVELVRALLDRIVATDARILAWETVDADGVLAAARYLEARRREGRPTDLLFGLPVGIKDVFHARGLPTTANFDPFRGRIAGEDAGVVRDLRAAGAIILGKTVTTQFASALDGVQTRNPWNRAHTPGGSSSGSAAAVAARQAPAAIGHQSTGSILRPAAYCGVVGLKPTFGRLSHYGLLPGAWTLDHPGVIVRSVADAALLLQALARHDPRDPYSATQPSENFVAAAREPMVPRLGLLRDLLDRAQPAVRQATEDAAQRLARAGAEVREVRLLAPMDLLLAVHRIIRASEAAAAHAEVHARWAEHYRPSVRALIEVGQLLPAAALVQAARLRRRLGALLAAWAGEVDALVGPTASNLPPLAEAGTGDPSFQAPWTLLGFPNITLPVGLSADGLPHGAQLIACPWAERRLLRVAAWCEAVLGPLPAPS